MGSGTDPNVSDVSFVSFGELKHNFQFFFSAAGRVSICGKEREEEEEEEEEEEKPKPIERQKEEEERGHLLLSVQQWILEIYY